MCSIRRNGINSQIDYVFQGLEYFLRYIGQLVVSKIPIARMYAKFDSNSYATAESMTDKMKSLLNPWKASGSKQDIRLPYIHLPKKYTFVLKVYMCSIVKAYICSS